MLKFLFWMSIPLLASGSIVAAQSVVVTPKKIVYKRPKPMADFKRTFTVTYPKVRASTPALSRKIESTISYLKVLQLDIREELSEVQWLEEANYKIDYNARGILVISLWMSGTGAYPDDVTKTVVVDVKSGTRVGASSAFTNLDGLLDLTRGKQRTEIDNAILELRKDPDAKDIDPAELFSDERFSEKDLEHFAIDKSGVTFIYEYGFPHVLKALEPDGRYHFSWTEIAPFVNRQGVFAQFLSR